MKIGWCEALPSAALLKAALHNEVGAAGKVSAQCNMKDAESDMRHSLQFLRRHWPAGGSAHALHRLSWITRDPARPETLTLWEAAHAEFHMTLTRGCGMPLLQNVCRVLHNLNDRYRRIFLQTEGGDRDVAAKHGEIAARAARREIEPACTSLRDHIQRTGTNLYRLATCEAPELRARRVFAATQELLDNCRRPAKSEEDQR